MMQEDMVLLIRYGEIHLKGLNRPFFLRLLIKSIKQALFSFNVEVEHRQSRVYVYGLKKDNIEEGIEKLTRVFGVHSVSPAFVVEKSFESIVSAAKGLIDDMGINANTSFKVFARRADKNFPMTSDDINRKLGEELLKSFPFLAVDVHNPQIRIGVEVREKCFVYAREIKCAGGMPSGSNGKALLLLSGGIDSPVAGYMIAKRGVSISAVHFFSHPYTSERAKEKVIELTKLLTRYMGEIRLHLVPFTEIQLAIYENCPKNETTVLMRRLMMRIAEKIGETEGAKALITGEAIGQVASQTLESLACTNDAVSIPVHRPLIGFDKNEIIERAVQIGTFETSILPYEDCCTVFVPLHPVTRPDLAKIKKSEAILDFGNMIESAIEKSEIIVCN